LRKFVASHPRDAHCVTAAIGAYVISSDDWAAFGSSSNLLATFQNRVAEDKQPVARVAFRAFRAFDLVVTLEEAVSLDVAPERPAANKGWIAKGSTRNIFDYEREPSLDEQFARWLDQINMIFSLVDVVCDGELLAWRASVNCVKVQQAISGRVMIQRRHLDSAATEHVPDEHQCIRQDELERVVYLRFDVNANNIEARSAISDRCAAGTTEQIEQSRTMGRRGALDRVVMVGRCFGAEHAHGTGGGGI